VTAFVLIRENTQKITYKAGVNSPISASYLFIFQNLVRQSHHKVLMITFTANIKIKTKPRHMGETSVLFHNF